jgi:hypothetical protein
LDSGGAGVKADPRNSAWQWSKEKHCPRLVDVHIKAMCPQGEMGFTKCKEGKQHREGRKQKPQKEKGTEAGMTTHTGHQAPPRAVN